MPPELPSYALDDHDEPVGWRRWIRGWRLIALLVAVIIVIAAALGAKPLYRELKAQRALAIAERAGAAIDRGDAAEASALLRQSALMAFDDERVAARVTYHAARTGDMASVAEIGKKLTDNEATPEEILVFGERSLAAGRPPDTQRALDALPATLPPADAARRAALEAGLFAAQARPADATSTLRRALDNLPPAETDALRVMLANLLLADPDRTHLDEARQLLEQAALGSGPDATAALRLLALSQAGLAPEAQEQLDTTLERLRTHPASTAADELFLAQLLATSNPDRQNEAIENLVTRLRTRDATLDERVIAARWLIGLRAHERVLDLITADEPTGHAGALMVRLDALSGLDRWEECSTLIETHRGGTLPDTLYHLFRARIAGSRNEPAAEDAQRRQLRQVMQFAELPHVLFAARYAESVGWKTEAFSAWRILATDSGARPDALRGQLRNLPPTATAIDGLEVTAQLLALQPEDPSIRLSNAFFALLAGQNIESAAALAEEFLSAEPDSIDIRRVAALGRLRQGQPAAALKIFPDDNNTEPRWQALHAALLRANNQKAAAEKLLPTIDQSTLTPEEKDLLR